MARDIRSRTAPPKGRDAVDVHAIGADDAPVNPVDERIEQPKVDGNDARNRQNDQKDLATAVLMASLRNARKPANSQQSKVKGEHEGRG